MRKSSFVLFALAAAATAFWLISRPSAQALEPAFAMQAATAPLTSSAMIGTERRQDDLPAIAASPDGSLWAVWLSYSDRRDEIGLRQFRNNRWSNLQWVPGASGDSWLPQVGVDSQNRPWVVWSEQRDTNWDLAARYYDPAAQSWGPIERLTRDPMPDVNPRLASDGKGAMALVWQGFRGKNSNIFLKLYETGKWGADVRVTNRPANDWEPAVTFDSSGAVWVAYDSYKNGNYDVYLRSVKGAEVGPEMAAAETARFETRATVAADNAGRIWVAWEAGGTGWGKDTGYTLRTRTKESGVVLGGYREVRIRCLENGQWRDPAAPLLSAFTRLAGPGQNVYQPHVFTASDGTVWVAAKRRVQPKPAMPPAAGQRGYWEYYVTRYEAIAWTPAAPLPKSWGRSSTRLNAARAGDGSMWLAWSTDNRPEGFSHRPLRHEIYAGRLGQAPAPTKAGLIAPATETIEAAAGHTDEPGDLKAIRAYRTTAAGRAVRIVRGDFHRHTELSWDGGGAQDGSLQDFYRYMIDAASMDFGASTDHQGGADDYWWWYTQKMTDMHHLPGTYVPIFGYERSVTQPHGHRNMFFATRDGRVTPFLMRSGVEQFSLPAGPQGQESGVGSGDVVENDTKLLYDDIRRMGGIAISHTSATRMGTDWRDNDPKLEPVVEIFQGARTNYEFVGAPLSAEESLDAQHMKTAGYFPVGMVRNAWAKGYRLGIITSSDHGSTHYSYAMVYTDRFTRQGILDAIRRRHTYGATDNILLDVRMGEHFMGSEFKAEAPLPLRVKIRGTRAVARVEVVRGDKMVYSSQPNRQNVSFEFTDKDPGGKAATHYYYVRVQQADGQLAWSSPIWVNYAGRTAAEAKATQ